MDMDMDISENTFNVDQVTLACLVSNKHKKVLEEMNPQYAALLNDTRMSYNSSSPASSLFYDTIQENREWLLQTFSFMLDNPVHTNTKFQPFVESLLRDRSTGHGKKIYEDATYDCISDEEHDDEPVLFGKDCKDLRAEGAAREPSKIEYWKMQHVFRTEP